MAKTWLPLLLIFSAVAGDDISDLCTQLTTQLNYLQNLVPLEIDVMFPRSSTSQYITGPAQYRIVSQLTLPSSACSSTPLSGSYKRHVTIKMQNERSYIISPTRILSVYQPSYILELDVEQSGPQGSKRVTVSGFSFDCQRINENSSEIALPFRSYINMKLKDSIIAKLHQKLSVIFQGEERVQINRNLVRELMANVFQVAAQDF